jgi:hypothetical protein
MPINLSEKNIKENLEFLKSHLPPKPTAVEGFYKLPKDFSQNVIDSNFSQNSLQKISDHIGYFLGILKSVKVTFVEETTDPRWTISNDGMVFMNKPNTNVSGLYKVLGHDHSEILLIRKNRYQLKHILAILAHEYAHHYLYKYNIKKNNKDENEILTEMATAYLGLGQFLVNGYKPIVWTSDYYNYVFASGYTTHTVTIGYVTPETIKKAIILSAELRKWNPKEVVNSFSSIFDKIIIYFKLWPYRSEVKKIKYKKDQYIIKDKIKKELVSIEEKYKEISSNFDKHSKTINLSLISAEDGKKFVELANEISSEYIFFEINKISKNLFNEEYSESTKEEINNLKKRIITWQKLLDKYK